MAKTRAAFLQDKPALRLLLDGLLGFFALAAIMACFVLSPNPQDIRPVLVVAFCGFYLAVLAAPFGRRGVDPAGLAILLAVGLGIALAMSAAKLALTDGLLRALVLGMALAGAGFAVVSRLVGRFTRSAGLIFVLGVAAAVLFAVRVTPWVLDQSAFVDRARAVPPFRFHDLTGAETNSADLKGRVVVLSYWATWCPPCQAEMPQIAAIQRRYRNDPRVRIIPIDAGYGGDDAERARVYLQRRNLGLDSAIDDIPVPGRQKNLAGVGLGLKVVPTLYVLDRAGDIAATHVGYDSAEHLAKTLDVRIERLLATR